VKKKHHDYPIYKFDTKLICVKTKNSERGGRNNFGKNPSPEIIYFPGLN